MASLSTASARTGSQPQPYPFNPSPPNRFAEAAWRYVRSQLTADVLAAGAPRAHLPLTNIFWHMPSSDQQWVLSAFQNLVNSLSQWSILPKEDLAICHLTNHDPQDRQQIDYISKSEKMIRRATLKKVPRPLNSFILYRKDRQEMVKQDHPGLCNNDISKILGRQWKTETEEIRAFYISKAEAAKLAHVAQYPDYQYRPRRPEEKKRRMTKNKKLKMEQRLQMEQAATSMIKDQIDQFLLKGCVTGYICSSHPDAQSPSDAVIHLHCRDFDFDFDTPTRTAAEGEMDAFPWEDLNSLVNYEDIPDAYSANYMRTPGVIPGIYLLPVNDEAASQVPGRVMSVAQPSSLCSAGWMHKTANILPACCSTNSISGKNVNTTTTYKLHKI